MPINPGRNEQRALDDALGRMLASVHVGRDRYTVNVSCFRVCGDTLCKHEPWRTYLSRTDVMFVLRDHIERVIQRTKPSTDSSLADAVTAGAFQQLHNEIREFFLSIPRKYHLWIELPSMPAWGVGEFRLGNTVTWVQLDQRAAEDLCGSSSPQPLMSRPFLRISCEGYGSHRADTSAVSDGLATLKHIFAYTASLNVFDETFEDESVKVQCLLTDDASPGVSNIVWLPKALERYLACVFVDEGRLEVLDTSSGQTLLAATRRRAETREEKLDALKDYLFDTIAIVDCPADIPDAARIKTALEWAFDSERSDNQTLAFLQACIGIEALLGDDDKEEPLTARLADRCAYLLGQGLQQREGIRKRFKDIYEVRSKVIHGRRARLGASEQLLLFEAQRMLRDMISRESFNLLRTLREHRTWLIVVPHSDMV